MSKNNSISDYLNTELAIIDELMISNGIPLRQRPSLALEIISDHIIEAKIDEKKFKPILGSDDSASQRIFFYLHNNITTWYKYKYGKAFSSLSSNKICGLVVCMATQFLIDVPITILKPSKQNKTYWLHFPLNIHDSENPISWLRSPPNLSRLSPKELSGLTNSCKDITILIRNLYNKIIGIFKGSTAFNGLIDNTLTHIKGAATKSFPSHDSDINAAATYEIQMACESIFKALLLQKRGGFPKTHHLKDLYNEAREYLIDFDYSIIERIPSWNRINKYRYGESDSINLIDYNEAYQAMLYIVDSVSKPMVSIWLKEAAIELAKDPFAKGIPRSH
jgi:hypothetical protein